MAVRKKNKKRKNRAVNKGCITALVICLVVAALIATAVLIALNVFKNWLDSSPNEIPEFNEKELYPLKYTDIIDKYSVEYNVPKSVILAMIKVESGFREEAVSAAGACGLMQLMPETFTWLAEKLGEEVTEDQIFDPEINIKYGTYYASRLYSQLGNWENVYAAYNAGPTRVSEWLSDPQYSENGVLTNIPYEETANHVYKLNTVRAKYIELYNLGE